MKVTVDINIEYARRALGVSGCLSAYKEMTDEEVKDALLFILSSYGITEDKDNKTK